MENKLDNLFKKFSRKGFSSIEIPGLVKDAVQLVGNNRDFTIAAVDLELEELGWGIGIMDDETYKLITLLVENTGLAEVERHIRS